MSEEIRTVDPDTGAQKGAKLAKFGLIPQGPLRELAEHFGKGSLKYADHNWRRGYNWSLSYDALCRHLQQFWDGEDYDEETGSKHIIAVAWHALALATFMDEHPEKDDRYLAHRAVSDEASVAAPPMVTITINTLPYRLPVNHQISYEDVVGVAGADRGSTVVYSGPGGSGSLVPGDSVVVFEGMHFDAVRTDRA